MEIVGLDFWIGTTIWFLCYSSRH